MGDGPRTVGDERGAYEPAARGSLGFGRGRRGTPAASRLGALVISGTVA